MVRNVLKGVLKLVVLALVYIVQIYVFNNTTFFGIKGDLCLMAVVLMALMEDNKIAYLYAGVSGAAADILFSTIPCKYIVIYILVTAVLIGMKKMYKQDSKMAIIIFAVLGTVTSEILLYIFNVISTATFVNIFSFIFLIIKESIINIFLAFVLYLALKICGKEE